nr:hypothetical protein [Rhodoferax sp.]
MFTPKDIVESEEYQLDRQATALKRAGNMDGAIAALRKRKALLDMRYIDDKLAKYLQAAGRFDEAMAEIQWLLDNSHAWARTMFGHQPASVQLLQRTIRTAQVHGAASLICKRAKQPALEAEHSALSQKYWSLRERLDPLAKIDQKVFFAERVAEMAQRRNEVVVKIKSGK